MTHKSKHLLIAAMAVVLVLAAADVAASRPATQPAAACDTECSGWSD